MTPKQALLLDHALERIDEVRERLSDVVRDPILNELRFAQQDIREALKLEMPEKDESDE